MARCNDCNKFVSYDTEAEPEEDSEPAIEGTTFTATYRRVLTCAECGSDLKEAQIEVEEDLSDLIDEHCPAGSEEEPDHEWEANLEVTPTERQEKRSKFYGVEVVGKMTCTRCKKTVQIKADNEEDVSAFDEC